MRTDGMDATMEMPSAVAGERRRQDEKWGASIYPNTGTNSGLINRACSLHRMALFYEIPSASRVKYLCDNAAREGRCTWAHILVEEVAGVIEAATLHDKVLSQGLQPGAELLTELIQVAAVAVRWAETLADSAVTGVGAGEVPAGIEVAR